MGADCEDACQCGEGDWGPIVAQVRRVPNTCAYNGHKLQSNPPASLVLSGVLW